MKSEKFSIMLSLFAIIIFFVSALVCYIKINSRVSNIEVPSSSVSIFTFDKQDTTMDISGLNMLKAMEEPIATSSAILNAYYHGEDNSSSKFDIVMHNDSSYKKTPGVDGINALEYTYEVLKDNEVIVPETQIESYDANSDVILLSDTLYSSKEMIKYTIIFRFYVNKYDQSHLMGTTLISNLKVNNKLA